MQYAQCSANDGCTLAYQTSHPAAAADGGLGAEAGAGAADAVCILLMHGFSGSSAYFGRNFAALRAAGYRVVAPDMRGHGRSGRTRGGYHVARLAADLRDLIADLRGCAQGNGKGTGNGMRIVPVGCSIGAAVLWTYVELFGCGDFAGFVFVDQAPLQDRSPFGGDDDGGAWDASRAHRGCYDEATMRAAQEALVRDPGAARAGLVADCLGYRVAAEAGDAVTALSEEADRDERFFTQISAQCDPVWLARLLADHTRYDHREAIEAIDVPTLVMAGRRTGCFPLDGMREPVRRIEKIRPGLAAWSVFDAGHWLFYEEPERFNREIVDFVRRCTVAE